MNAVLLFQERFHRKHFVRPRFFYVRSYDIDIGYHAHKFSLFVDDGQVPQPVTEEDAGGIVHAHLGYGAHGPHLHDLAYLSFRLIRNSEKLLGCNKTDKIFFLGNGKAVEVGIADPFRDLFNGHIRTDG